MIASLIDRKQLKAEVRALLADAEVSPKAMTALYSGLTVLLSLLTYISGTGILSTFVSILTTLLSWTLLSGFVMYCMAIRRGERAEFLTLFDGFSFAGKVIALNIVMMIFIWLWSMLFVIPGIIASYRYRFALYNLYENPGIGVMEALDMSKRQTTGYKSQLLMLDLSYLGWLLLAALPVYVESAFLVTGMVDTVVAFAASGAIPPMAASAAYTVLPAWGWTLISGLWSLAVGLFYLPHYQCVELGYFEIAKNTSGVGDGAQENNWTSGPDNMGGF